ncbi:conserved hypothetical protein [Vibrio phage 417E50-1]|nr:conserved hypothetical protein [Vibrio phage 417E50-1]
MKCESMSCDNDAEFFDIMQNQICEECMNREIESEGGEQEDYEVICDAN